MIPALSKHRPAVLRVMRFGVVGLSGVGVNEAVFALALSAAAAPPPAMVLNGAAILGFAVSVSSNFALNSLWTWRDRAIRSGAVAGMRRAGAYLLVALAALGLQLAVLNALVASGWTPLLANLAGIGAGTVINFVLNNLWTFRDLPEPWSPWPEQEPKRSIHALEWASRRASHHRYGEAGSWALLTPLVLSLGAFAGLMLAGWRGLEGVAPAELAASSRFLVFWLNTAQAFAIGIGVFEGLYRRSGQKLMVLLPVDPRAWFVQVASGIFRMHAAVLLAVAAPVVPLFWLAPPALALTALGSLVIVYVAAVPAALALHLLAGLSLHGPQTAAKRWLEAGIAPPGAALLFYAPAVAFAGAMGVVLAAEVAFRIWLEVQAASPVILLASAAIGIAVFAGLRARAVFSLHYISILPRFWESEVVAPLREEHLPNQVFGLKLGKYLPDSATRALFRRDLIQMKRRYRADLLFAALAGLAAWAMSANLPGLDGWSGWWLGVAVVGVWLNPAPRLIGSELENRWTLVAMPISNGSALLAKFAVCALSLLWASLALGLGWALGGGLMIAAGLTLGWLVVGAICAAIVLWAGLRHPERSWVVVSIFRACSIILLAVAAYGWTS